MQELHNSVMGRKLIEHDIPEIHKQLKRIADSLELLTKREIAKREKKRHVTYGAMIEKVSPGEYVVTYNEDKWRVYRESVGSSYWWYADNVTNPKGKAFRADTKNDVISKLKASYPVQPVTI